MWARVAGSIVQIDKKFSFQHNLPLGIAPPGGRWLHSARVVGSVGSIVNGVGVDFGSVGSAASGLDLVYEAALVPELWPRALDQIATRCGAAGGLIITGYPDGVRWTASEELRGLMQRGIDEGWMALNTRARKAAATEHAGFIGDLDLHTQEEIARDPFYGYLRSQGFGWCTGTLIPDLNGGVTIFNWEARTDHGPFEDAVIRSLDPLRPHLARAALLASRLGLEKARTAAAVLENIGLAAAVLSGKGRVVAANALFEPLIPGIAEDRRDRLRLTDSKADESFVGALERLRRLDATAAPLSIPLRTKPEGLPVILHVIPVTGHGTDLFGAASCIAVLTPVKPSRAPGHAVVQGLYDLTPAEARIACAVAEAKSVEEVALTAGVSTETVRTHLKSIFSKVGVSRQVELSNLLTGAALPT